MISYIRRINDNHYTPPVLLICHLCPFSSMCLHPPWLCLLLYNQTRELNKTHHLWDIRHRSIGHPFSSLPLWSNHPSGYPVHLSSVMCFFFCHHSPIHPSTFPSVYPCFPSLLFSSVLWWAIMSGWKDLYRLIFVKERKEQRREIGQNAGGKVGGQSVVWKYSIGRWVSLCLCGVAHLASLNSVIEMTNRAAFFSLLQQLKLDILSLASRSWSPRPWNWIWLWVHSWSDSMLVVRLFFESWVAVTSTGVLCSITEKRICGEWQFRSFMRMVNLIIWKNIWKSSTILVIAVSRQVCVCN